VALRTSNKRRMFATAQPSSFPWTILIGARGIIAADAPWTMEIATRKVEDNIMSGA